jgi:hypothetical protein
MTLSAYTLYSSRDLLTPIIYSLDSVSRVTAALNYWFKGEKTAYGSQLTMLSVAVGILLNSLSSYVIGIRISGLVEPSSFSRRLFYYGIVTLLKLSWKPALVPLENGFKLGYRYICYKDI